MSRLPHRGEDGLHVDGKGLIVVLVGELFDGLPDEHARVVHENVQLAESFHGFANKCRNLCRLCSVRFHGLTLAAGFAYSGNDLRGRIGRRRVTDDDVRAFGRETFRDRGSDAPAPTCDEGGFALKAVMRLSGHGARIPC